MYTRKELIMNIGFYFFYKRYNKNRIFTESSFLENDDATRALYLFGPYVQQRGHKLNTIDMEANLANYDSIVFFEFPTFANEYFKQLLDIKFQNLYLILMEHEMVRPGNRVENYQYFKKIGTWNDDYVDNVKYFKINYTHRIPKTINFDLTRKEKLCTLINSYKLSSAPMELYSERIRAIQWFEQNHPEDFDLYGGGWDSRKYPSYKGSIPSKKEIFQKYKFSICYENARTFPGYITEKIFDCFIAGCVPVYLGAPNITAHIPSKSFIDKRNFQTYERLYKYLKNMPETEYIDYLDAIRDFFSSVKSYPFSPEFMIDVLANKILCL
jgi:hypothetical protein